MHSKMVADRQKLSESLEASASTHAADVNQRVIEVLSAVLAEGETVPDLALVQILVGRLIARARGHMVEVDRAHLDEIVKDRGLRRQRDDAAKNLRRTVLRIRDSFDGAYGPGRCEEILGFGTSIPQDPMLLRQLATAGVEYLTDPAFELPPMELAGVAWSPDLFAEQLRAPLADLEQAQTQLSREDRKSNKTIEIKNQAIEDFDDTSRRCFNFFQGFYSLAGEDLLAERVRPTSRRSRPAESEPDEATEASPEALPLQRFAGVDDTAEPDPDIPPGGDS